MFSLILISASSGEEQVVEAIRRGASDYVTMNKLERLNGIVRRELIQYRQNRETVAELKTSKNDMRHLFNQ